MGAQLLGVDSVEADVEMIAMMIDGLKKTGLEDFQVRISVIWISFRDCWMRPDLRKKNWIS